MAISEFISNNSIVKLWCVFLLLLHYAAKGLLLHKITSPAERLVLYSRDKCTNVAQKKPVICCKLTETKYGPAKSLITPCEVAIPM